MTIVTPNEFDDTTSVMVADKDTVIAYFEKSPAARNLISDLLKLTGYIRADFQDIMRQEITDEAVRRRKDLQ